MPSPNSGQSLRCCPLLTQVAWEIILHFGKSRNLGLETCVLGQPALTDLCVHVQGEESFLLSFFLTYWEVL